MSLYRSYLSSLVSNLVYVFYVCQSVQGSPSAPIYVVVSISLSHTQSGKQ